MKTTLKSRIDPASHSVFVTLEETTIRPDAVLTAAHVLSRKAEVWLGEEEVELRPKAGQGSAAELQALAAEFAEEAVTQELRRRVAETNRSVRDYLITQALVTASGAQGNAQPAMGNLTEDQEKDIDQLIAEAEKELAGGQPAATSESDVRKP